MTQYLKCGAVKKHIVLKIEDVERLGECYQETFANLNKIETLILIDRSKRGKSINNEYLVINTDEPYINEIIDILKKHNQWGDINAG